MNTATTHPDVAPTRRAFLQGGSLVVLFALGGLQPLAAQAPAAAPLPGSLNSNRRLDAWIRINPDGTLTMFTGKVELGQGILTALTQIVADELDVEPQRLQVVSGDTGPARRTKASPPAACPSRTAAPRCAWPAPKRARCCWAPRRRSSMRPCPSSRCATAPSRAPPPARPHHLLGSGAERLAGARSHGQGRAQAGRRAPLHRPVDGAPRHPGQGDRGRRPTCRTSACRAWCMRAWCARRCRARACWRPTSMPSRPCRACWRWCATATSWPSPRSAKSRPSPRRARWLPSAKWEPMAPLPPTGAALFTMMKSARMPRTAWSATRTPARPRRPAPRCWPAEYTQALPGARLHRPVVRGGAVGRRQAAGVVPFAGRVPAARRHGQGAAHAARGHHASSTRRLGLLRPQRRRRRGARCGAGRQGAAQGAGAAAVDARGRVRHRAVRLADGDADARRGGRRQGRRLAARAVELHAQHAPERSRTAATCWRPGSWPTRCRPARRATSRSPRAAATAMRCRCTRSGATRSSTTCCSTSRSAPRRCARWAPTPTCSRPSPSWTNWPAPRAPTRCSSGWRTWRIRVPAPSSRRSRR
jgi:hypothetical protein